MFTSKSSTQSVTNQNYFESWISIYHILESKSNKITCIYISEIVLIISLSFVYLYINQSLENGKRKEIVFHKFKGDLKRFRYHYRLLLDPVTKFDINDDGQLLHIPQMKKVLLYLCLQGRTTIYSYLL